MRKSRLKFENMLESGGEAKAAVAAGHVLLNGQIETQKRKKIMADDTIEFAEEKIRIKLSQLEVTRIVTSQEHRHDQ